MVAYKQQGPDGELGVWQNNAGHSVQQRNAQVVVVDSFYEANTWSAKGAYTGAN